MAASLFCCFLVTAFVSDRCLLTVSAGRIFTENFEGGPSTLEWNLFEEVVTNCYSKDIGRSDIETDSAYEGDYGITLFSNSNQSSSSNHLIAGRNVSNGATGISMYELHAMLPAAYEFTSQVGPEFSIQNTRDDGPGSTTTTSIAGIQHVASTYITNKWNIWVNSTLTTAVWEVLPSSVWDSEPTIAADTWYKYVMLVDFDKNEYISLSVQEAVDGGTVYLADLVGYTIAPELRGFESATVLTLEAENLYNNCGAASVFQAKMFYDKVRFEANVNTSNTFELVWEYEFNKHHPDYTDHDVLSWDFNIFAGNFGSSSNAYFVKSNAVVKDDRLVLAVTNVTNGGRMYSASGIGSWPAHAQIYGKWEVEAKMPAGYGVTGYIGLFLSSKVWPPEVDFAEIIGREPKKLFLTQHYGNASAHQQVGVEHVEFDVDAWSDAFHIYSVEWVPGKISYLVDGVLVLEQAVEFDETNATMDVSIGIATGDCGSGSFVNCPENNPGSNPSLPAYLTVNYVNVYAYVAPPTLEPTLEPTVEPTLEPTLEPSAIPTIEGTATPAPTSVSQSPSEGPSDLPSSAPTNMPTATPTAAPTTATPMISPTATPTLAHVTASPTTAPTPTVNPPPITEAPVYSPTAAPTLSPNQVVEVVVYILDPETVEALIEGIRSEILSIITGSPTPGVNSLVVVTVTIIHFTAALTPAELVEMQESLFEALNSGTVQERRYLQVDDSGLELISVGDTTIVECSNNISQPCVGTANEVTYSTAPVTTSAPTTKSSKGSKSSKGTNPPTVPGITTSPTKVGKSGKSGKDHMRI